jgi:hypothetical protein
MMPTIPAIKLFQLADSLDEAYLERRIREDTLGDFSLACLKEYTR